MSDEWRSSNLKVVLYSPVTQHSVLITQNLLLITHHFLSIPPLPRFLRAFLFMVLPWLAIAFERKSSHQSRRDLR
jgi:hypothetical protein